MADEETVQTTEETPPEQASLTSMLDAEDGGSEDIGVFDQEIAKHEQTIAQMQANLDALNRRTATEADEVDPDATFRKTLVDGISSLKGGLDHLNARVRQSELRAEAGEFAKRAVDEFDVFAKKHFAGLPPEIVALRRQEAANVATRGYRPDISPKAQVAAIKRAAAEWYDREGKLIAQAFSKAQVKGGVKSVAGDGKPTKEETREEVLASNKRELASVAVGGSTGPMKAVETIAKSREDLANSAAQMAKEMGIDFAAMGYDS
jgi:hypothetical protein